MRQNRRYARVRPSGQVATTGKIIVDGKAGAIDCSIIDYGAGGVCLQVKAGVSLPRRFELLHGATRKKCRVAWMSGSRFGVSFQ